MKTLKIFFSAKQSEILDLVPNYHHHPIISLTSPARFWKILQNPKLVGGFKYFICSLYFGKMNLFWLIFFRWVETTNQKNIWGCVRAKVNQGTVIMTYQWLQMWICLSAIPGLFQLGEKSFSYVITWSSDCFEAKKFSLAGGFNDFFIVLPIWGNDPIWISWNHQLVQFWRFVFFPLF